MELYGPNAWLNGFISPLLKQALIWPVNWEKRTPRTILGALLQGKAWTDEHLFNGNYYVQTIGLKDRSVLERYDESAVRDYWNDEAKEIKYQVADGRVIDQVLAQWHANLCGLGEIFDPEQTRKSLASIYLHNFKKHAKRIQPMALVQLERRSRINDMYMAGRHCETDRSAHLLDGNNERLRISGDHSYDSGRNGRRRHGDRRSDPRPVRRRTAESVERVRMRKQLCPIDGQLCVAAAFSGFEYDMTEKSIGFQPITEEEFFRASGRWIQAGEHSCGKRPDRTERALRGTGVTLPELAVYERAECKRDFVRRHGSPRLQLAGRSIRLLQPFG